MLSPRLYLVLLAFSWVMFFIFQVFIKTELPITGLALVFSTLLLWRREKGEGALYVFGMFMGLIIEVGLGQIARTQHWEYASLFGVPYWLPLIWGYGFVVMRRIGNLIVDIFQ